MASLYGLTIGQQIEFLRVLAAAGFAHEHIVRIIKDPDLAKKMRETMPDDAAPTVAVYPPPWWRTPEQQLARALTLWPGAHLPDAPRGFVPRTSSEVLLLHVPDMLDSLWSKVIAPQGYSKDGHESGKWAKRLRVAQNKRDYAEPTWLAFDFASHKDFTASEVWGSSDLAASEVLSAMIQFPEWIEQWGKEFSTPSLTGYQVKYGPNLVPYPLRKAGRQESPTGALRRMVGCAQRVMPHGQRVLNFGSKVSGGPPGLRFGPS